VTNWASTRLLIASETRLVTVWMVGIVPRLALPRLHGTGQQGRCGTMSRLLDTQSDTLTTGNGRKPRHVLETARPNTGQFKSVGHHGTPTSRSLNL
jgi:hypothetical protein